jgi:hypothetical protein
MVLTKFLGSVDDMLPARVISYDRASNRALVQPLIVIVTTDDKQVQRAQVASVPVFQMGGGGFVMSFPIAVGDIGWIKANDRDISIFKQTMASSAPNTQRKHSFEDAVFIPDTMLHGVTIAGEDSNNLVIQNLVGTVKLAFWPTFMKMLGRLGIGGSPNANAIFDVQSTTMAAMPWPRMTTSQRNAIPSPAEGMAVWNLTTHSLSVYNGTIWS